MNNRNNSSKRSETFFKDIDHDTAAAANVSAAAKLNINASVFVPRNVGSMPCNDEPPNSDHLEREPKEPKLMLPWKGFPKRVQKKSPCKVVPISIDWNTEKSKGWMRPESMIPAHVVKNPLLEQKPMKAQPDNWRERERKVAVKAVILDEQRRMREPLAQSHGTVHLTREPIDFTADERVVVDRLRNIKRERIELALQEHKRDVIDADKPEETKVEELAEKIMELKLEKKPEPQAEVKPTVKSVLPKRYIPTNKQWDERCKAKAREAGAKANKENTMAGILKDEQESDASQIEVDNTVPRSKSEPVRQPEKRRGNLIHSRNIWRAFGNRGLLPTPNSGADRAPQPQFELPSGTDVTIKRYDIEELLSLEPEASQLETPLINEIFRKFAFLNE